MKPRAWEDGMSIEETADLAYWERNMLALTYAHTVNNLHKAYLGVQNIEPEPYKLPCGWYTHGEWQGFSRVISLDNGRATFHVPDDFDLGDLPQVEPNFDGHTTLEKWVRVMDYCGCEVDDID